MGSGLHDGRCDAQLQRLKRDIAAGKIDLVICFELDRITRSLKDFVDLWALFAEHDVDVISLREKFDTSMPTGEAMVQLIMVFAQLERKMPAERTFSIMRDRADRGLWNGGHILGYRSRKDDPGKLEIDEEGAAIVRRIFDLFEELGSAGAVTRRLNDLGIRYPIYRTRSDKQRGGNRFTKQKIIGILRNAVYIGQIRWGDSVKEGCHDPIITQQQSPLNQSTPPRGESDVACHVHARLTGVVEVLSKTMLRLNGSLARQLRLGYIVHGFNIISRRLVTRCPPPSEIKFCGC